MPLPSWIARLLADRPVPGGTPNARVGAGGRSEATPDVAEARVRGMPVLVINSRPDVDTADALARLDLALGLVAEHVPHRFRHLRRDVQRLVVRRYPCRGAYDPATGDCLVELTFVVNRDFTPAQVAATIVHEGAHARLHRLGFSLDMADRERQERFCRRAEIEFGSRAPGAAAVVERALAILEAEGVDVAPVIDPALAAARVAAAARAALAERAGACPTTCSSCWPTRTTRASSRPAPRRSSPTRGARRASCAPPAGRPGR